MSFIVKVCAQGVEGEAGEVILDRVEPGSNRLFDFVKNARPGRLALVASEDGETLSVHAIPQEGQVGDAIHVATISGQQVLSLDVHSTPSRTFPEGHAVSLVFSQAPDPRS
jgi:hypothetical protein